ncbi:MAG: hypothetical protein IE891_06275 [Flavobacteriaceae bacterium]|nr:hypothetical protein [Flavobacteriaceae bacterium]
MLKLFLRILLLILVCSSSFLNAQNNCKCELKNIDNEIYLLNARDSSQVFDIVHKLEASKNEVCKFKSLGLQLAYYNTKLNLKSSDETFNKLNDAFNSSTCKNELKYSYYHFLSEYYTAKNDFNKLSEFAFKELKEAEKRNNVHEKIEAIKSIVFLFTRLKESDRNWEYIKKAEKLIIASNDSIHTIRDYRWLAFQYENKYTRTNRKTLLDSALIFVKRAKIGAKKYNLNDELALSYRVLEACSYHKGEYNNALKYIDSAIFYGKRIKGEKNLGSFYLSKAWDYIDLNQKKNAITYADSAIYYDNSKDIAGNMMMFSEVSQIYEEGGDLKKAFNSFKKYTAMKDTILKRDRIKIVNELETKYKTELKDAQIKNLNQQQKINELTIKNKEVQFNRLFILFIVAVSLLTFVLFIMKMRELRKTKAQNKSLQNAIEKQHQLESELTEVRENIAQDFHDDLGNRLARISLISNIVNNELKNDEKLKEKVKQITDDSNELYMGTRDFIFSLKQNSDYVDELVTYLSDFGEDFFSKNQIQFKVSRQIDENLKLPYYWSRQLIFIFKEAMTNAFKHSKGKNVELDFVLNQKTLKISFSDDGNGFDAEQLKSTNGLKNMKTRAKKIGGELQFVSDKNGTSIIFNGIIKHS